MFSWFLATKVPERLLQLKNAEESLLEWAEKFGDSNCRIEKIDTAIPSHGKDLVDLNPGGNEWTIHSLRVTSPRQSNDTTPPLVLLHGFGNGAAYFYRNLFGLASVMSAVHSLDWLGWGLSSRPEEGPTEDMVIDSIESWRQKQKIEKMVLAGHSMGGYASVAYSERYPERVERLILISPAGVPKPNPEVSSRKIRDRSLSFRMIWSFWSSMYDRKISLGSVYRALPFSSKGELPLNYIKRRVPDISDPAEQETVANYLHCNMYLPGSGERVLFSMLSKTLMGNNPLIARIPNLAVKNITFLYGSHDWMDINAALEVQSACSTSACNAKRPEVTVYRVKNAGHLLMLDNWREHNAGVLLGAGKKVNDNVPELVVY